MCTVGRSLLLCLLRVDVFFGVWGAVFWKAFGAAFFVAEGLAAGLAAGAAGFLGEAVLVAGFAVGLSVVALAASFLACQADFFGAGV